MYDAIVIGARCAGSPTAMLLAKRGYKVLLLDRDGFPSDVMSTHFVHQAGTARLQGWGLLDQVRDSNCPAVTKTRFDFGPFAVQGSAPPVDGVSEAFAPRRRVLDKILVDAAVAAGAELRERFSVRELIVGEDGAVRGVRGSSAGGSEVSEKARIVIGADGLHSLVARSVAAPVTHEHAIVSCGYYSYWSNFPADAFEVHPREGWATAAFPTNDGLTCVIVGSAIKNFAAFRTDVEGTYLRTLQSVPSMAERMSKARREERILGSGEFVNQFRKPYGNGWALVGDAGYHKDPSTAQGISDAFRDAELLTEAIDAGFSGRQALAQTLASYEERRNQAAMPMFDFTCHLAALEPPSEDMQHLFGALAHSPEHAGRFAGILAGSVSIPEFFSEASMGSIFAAAGAATA